MREFWGYFLHFSGKKNKKSSEFIQKIRKYGILGANLVVFTQKTRLSLRTALLH